MDQAAILWENLPKKNKERYKRLILAFASLSEAFAQKINVEEDENGEEKIKECVAPIINSKFQETSFQRAFQAVGEDIQNTSFDASLIEKIGDKELKYLIGIKTFGIDSGMQKIAQFKAISSEWSTILQEIEKNAEGKQSKAEINESNKELYLNLAKKISKIRNERIESSKALLKGFKIDDKDDIYAIYHVLMPSKKGTTPNISVGETSYEKIDIENIEVDGCTKKNNPRNFSFHDGHHSYRYTSADSQLLMDFNNKDIVIEKWPVKYAEDAVGIFENLAKEIYGEEEVQEKKPIIESFSWFLTNSKNEVERFSGFNSFNGTGSKKTVKNRKETIEKMKTKFNYIDKKVLKTLEEKVQSFYFDKALIYDEKLKKEELREEIIHIVETINNEELLVFIKKALYRPITELYIPIPNSKEFHTVHTDFFGKDYGKLEGKKLLHKKAKFNLVFEPSKESIPCFLTQDYGKGIESCGKQSLLGEWILYHVFRLKPYEPLTKTKLDEIGINGIRIYKYENSEDIHLEFIWIDENNLPNDLITKEKKANR